MGLDGVELIVSIEDEFQIEILDIEAENIFTVGDIYECVLRKLAFSPEELKKISCKSQHYFYELRKILMEEFQQQRKTISPKTSLKTVFKKEKIKERWEILAQRMNLKMPTLERPKWLENFIGWTLLLSFISVPFIAVVNGSFYWSSLFLLIPFIGTLLHGLTEPFAVYPRMNTIGELIDAIISINHRELVLSKSSKTEVYWILKGIIANKTGAPIGDIKYNAKIVEDLGIE